MRIPVDVWVLMVDRDADDISHYMHALSIGIEMSHFRSTKRECSRVKASQSRIDKFASSCGGSDLNLSRLDHENVLPLFLQIIMKRSDIVKSKTYYYCIKLILFMKIPVFGKEFCLFAQSRSRDGLFKLICKSAEDWIPYHPIQFRSIGRETVINRCQS